MKRKPHRWTYPISRKCPWSYCVACGLVWFKNKASRKAIKKPCVDYEDEQ